MRVVEHIKKGNGISVEVEPPLLGEGIQQVFAALDPLVEHGVSYVDITYHSEQIIGFDERDGCSIPVRCRKKPGTVGVAGAIIGRYGGRVQPVPHVICTSFSRYDTEEFLIDLYFLGVRNIMAFRGDPQKGPDGKSLPFVAAVGGYDNAVDLVRQIVGLRSAKYVGAEKGEPVDFCIGGACYPEKHPLASSLAHDIDWLKRKVDAGVDYVVTQMFFNNEAYLRFRDRASSAGVSVPIVPGLFPFTAHRYLKALPRVFGCSIPQELASRAEEYKKKPDDLRRVGIEWCIDQCRDLERHGAPSLHFYLHNNAPVLEVVKAIR